MNSRLTAILMIAVSILIAGGTSFASAAPSAVDQYTEQVPTAGGEKPSDGGAGGSGSSGTGTGSGQAAPVAEDPATAGTDGAVNEGSSDGQGASGSDGSGSVGPDADEASSGAAPSAATDAIVPDESDDGMGWLFPLLLIAVALAAIGFAVARHQSRRTRIT